MNTINVGESPKLTRKPIHIGKSPITENPLELTSIKIVRMFLMTIGCWPDEQFGKKLPIFVLIQKRTLGSQVFVILMGTSYYLLYNIHDINFFAVGHILITAFLCILMIVRVSLPQFEEYGLIVKEFTNIHLIHYKDKGKHYKETYEYWNKVSHYFAYYEVAMMCYGLLMYVGIPVYNNYALGAFRSSRPDNLTYDYAIFFKYPGYIQDDHFYLSILINIYCSYNCSVSLTSVDLLLSLIVFQIIGHIKTLMMDMETMPRPKRLIDVTHEFPATKGQEIRAYVEKYDAEENRIVHERLIQMIYHHRLIVGLAKRVSTFFGPMLALNYLIHLVSGCILLLECSSKNTKDVVRFGPLTTAIFGQLIQISSVFEFVGYMSEKLIDSAYYLPWECMDTRNQRTVLFLLNRIQIPIQLTAMGMVPVGVQTMLAILKSTLSFFAFLQTLSE